MACGYLAEAFCCLEVQQELSGTDFTVHGHYATERNCLLATLWHCYHEGCKNFCCQGRPPDGPALCLKASNGLCMTWDGILTLPALRIHGDNYLATVPERPAPRLGDNAPHFSAELRRSRPHSPSLFSEVSVCYNVVESQRCTGQMWREAS